MASLIETYDNVFFNQPRLCNLIDDINQLDYEKKKEKLEALGELINGYIRYRGCNFPNCSPMSISIFLEKSFKAGVLEDIIHELSGEERHPVLIQYVHDKTFITLY